MPAVSVIMPVFNGAPFLDRALTSLRTQALTDWELVAVDDASRDDSARRLDAFAAADPRVRVLRHPANRGQAATRNTALRAARGELVAYLDQDDEFYPDHLARAWSLRSSGDEGSGAGVLEALGVRLNRVRVVLIESCSSDDRHRLDGLLPGHTPFATSAHSPEAGVVKYVRTDVTGNLGARLG